MAVLDYFLSWEGETDLDLSVEVNPLFTASGESFPDSGDISYYPDDDDLGLPGGCCGNNEEILGLEQVDNMIAQVTTYGTNTTPQDAPFTLQVYRDGVLYQEETGTMLDGDVLLARTQYRWFDLCANAQGSAAAVGMIEMGDASGDSCLVPNPEPGPCWNYGATWAGNVGTTFSTSGYGPGSYSPSGTSAQTFTAVGTTPPDQYWGCEGNTYSEVVMNSVSSLWAVVLASQSNPITDGTCTTGTSASAVYGWGGVTVNIRCERSIAAVGGCRDFLPYGVTDSVYIGVKFNNAPGRRTAVIVEWSDSTTAANAAATFAVDLGAASQLAAADGRTFWMRGGAGSPTSDPIDNIYNIGSTSSAQSVAGGSIGAVFASALTRQGG